MLLNSNNIIINITSPEVKSDKAYHSTIGLERNKMYKVFVKEQANNFDFYLIQLTGWHCFEHTELTDVFNTDIVDKIKNKEVLLVMDASSEADYEIIDDIYTHLIIKQHIPESQILLLVGSPDIADYVKTVATSLNKEPIKVEWFLCFESIISDSEPPMVNPLKRKSFKKSFINLNRRWRPHRLALTALLYERGLLDKGYVSFSNVDIDNRVSWEEAWVEVDNWFLTYPETKKQLANGRQLIDVLPLYLDTDNLYINQAYLQYNGIQNFYSNTYFNVVSETHFMNLKPRFLSEKIFKAMYYRQPFILVSTPNSLELLKKAGYKTFSGLIDESYDSENDDSKRLLMIANEIERLSNLENTELEQFLKEAYSICDYNYKILVNKQIHSYRII